MSERRRELGLLVLIAAAAMVVRSAAASIGLMSDDFMQYGMIAGLYPGEGYAPFDLYAFLRRDLMVAHIEGGTAPWWAVPELHGTVLRPVSSLLLWLDHTLLPGRVGAWHLHSLLWFGAAIVGFGLVVGRLLPRSIAVIAVIVFACDASVVSPLAWLANRCVLVSASFGLLAMWVHLERRAPELATPAWLRGPGPLVEGTLMALCIGAGEYGLAILAYIVAWELLVSERSGRLRALVPALVPVLIYLLIHKALGYGTFGAETYVDPFHAPAAYLEAASERLPKLISAGFWSTPVATIQVFRFGYIASLADLLLGPEPSAARFDATHLGLVWLGILTASLLIVLARRGLEPDERKTVRALIIGTIVGLLPVAVAPAHSRLLLIAQLGVCCTIAAILVATARLLRPPSTPARRWRGAALLPFAGFLAYAHTIGDLRWGQAYIEHIDALEARHAAAITNGDLLGPDLGGSDVVILNAPNQVIGLYGPFMLHAQGWPAPATWRPLALGGEFPMVAERSGPHTLVLAAIQGSWIRTANELFFRRTDQPLRTGDVLVHPSLRVEILAGELGHPSKIRVDFDRPLERFIFIVATPQGLKRWTVPAPGERAVVPLPRLPKAP